MVVFWFLAFYVEQVVAALLFKYGADHPKEFWLAFFAGNAFGATSIYFAMKIYTVMQVNLGGALAGGGAFILCQMALVFFYCQRLTLIQYLGLAAVAFGMGLVSYGQAAQPAAPRLGPEVAGYVQASAVQTH